MSEWKPRVKTGLRWESLALTAEDGFLLSRIDGATSVMGLSHVTGLSLSKVQEGLRRLRESGALDVDASPSATSSAASASTARASTSARTAQPRPMPVAAAPTASDDDDDDALFDDLGADDELSLEGEATLEGDAVDDATSPAPVVVPVVAAPARDDVIVDDAPDAPAPVDAADDHSDDDDDAAAGDEDEDGDEKDGEQAEVDEGNYRKLFETTLHALPQDEREKLARTASGPTLLALCFDPVPAVVGGIFENPTCGFPHARLVARHHRTPQGLDDVLRRAEFARDAQVQRFLLANPMLNDAQLKKLLAPRRLDVVYKWALSRDLPEKNRTKVRLILRSKWSTADGEARAQLVFSTEGRALTMLIGLPFDSQTTTLLCARTYNSLMLIQNLARFSSTPPQVLQHLLKQALVKRQPHLRTLIAQHPNCPSDVKRKLREG